MVSCLSVPMIPACMPRSASGEVVAAVLVVEELPVVEEPLVVDEPVLVEEPLIVDDVVLVDDPVLGDEVLDEELPAIPRAALPPDLGGSGARVWERSSESRW